MYKEKPLNLKKQHFTQFIPNIERIPFSDDETCKILNIQNIPFLRATKSNLIKKSIAIHYRFDISFHFIGLFDIFEYALRRNLFFLNYGDQPDVNELVCSLVDELAFTIDNCLCSTSVPPPRMEQIIANIEILCREYSEKWQQFWLYDGDPFSASECSKITLQTWCEVFERAMNTIGLFEEHLDTPLSDPPNSSDGFAEPISEVPIQAAIYFNSLHSTAPS